MPLEERRCLEAELRTVTADVATGVSTKRNTAADTAWKQWEQFCSSFPTPLPFDLRGIKDPIPWLLLFQNRWRDGRLAPKGQPVVARTAEDGTRQVGQRFAILGTSDPRLNQHGKLDLRLQRQIAGWKKRNPPTQRRNPVPRSVLVAATTASWAASTPKNLAISDLMWLGFYFLLRPSEYLRTSNEDQRPFLLQDVHFRVQARHYTATTIPLHLLNDATTVGLHFSLQKNGISGETIWLGRAREPHACPVQAAARRVRHLRENAAEAHIPLHTFYDDAGRARAITDKNLTALLRLHATAQGLDVDVSIGGLRATGATALLNSGTSVTLIKLIGRWRSDEVMRYLHTQSTVSEPLAGRMLANLR
jgi:hypothetical protein